jgi:hypothetical protein
MCVDARADMGVDAEAVADADHELVGEGRTIVMVESVETLLPTSTSTLRMRRRRWWRWKMDAILVLVRPDPVTQT